MSGQELVDELRAQADGTQNNTHAAEQAMLRAADRVEALEAELADLAEVARTRRAQWRTELARAERAEQKSAELAAVIAEALADEIHIEAVDSQQWRVAFERVIRILSAADTSSALSAYTTRVREEAVAEVEDERGAHLEAFRLIRERIAMEDVPIHVAADIDQCICERAGVWSEIPEGQNDNE